MNREELKAIIEFAVNSEEESNAFYLEAKSKVEDSALKDLFQDLADEELEHKKFLRDFLETGADTIRISPSSDYKLAEVMEAPELTTDVTFPDAIMIAIKNEESAMYMYQGLADSCEDAEERDIFIGLKNMEQMHTTRLEEIYTNVAYREIW